MISLLKKKTSFLVFLFLLLLPLSLQNKELLLDQEVEGSIQIDDGYDFYSITLKNPPIDKEDTYNLIFKVEEQKGDLGQRDDFSDVDIYVSMENTMPQNSASATWFSERYGDDLITISKKHIREGATFHIGVYCQFRCKYKLKAYLNEMIEITEGRVNSYLIPKGSSMYFKFITKDHDYEQLSFAFISPKMRPFQLYISDHNPSNQNTFKVTPSWISGYTFDIVRGDRYYCKSCEYRILIQAKDEDADVRMIVTYPQSTLTLRQGEQIFDSVLEKKAKCYNYDLLLMQYDDNLIINLVLFSGTVVTQIYGFREEYDRRFERIPYDQFTFEVSSEKVIVLNQNMINALKKPFDLGTKLHFCVYGKEKSSYMISTYFSGQTQNLQRLNFLVMGQTITGYLPRGQVTRYRILDFSSDAHITLSLDNVEGDSELYAMYSKRYQSLFIDESSLMRDKGNSSFFKSYETFSGYDVDIPNKENVCHQEISQGGNLSDEIKKLNCGIFAVIYCDKNSKSNHCIYRLRANSDKSVQTLIPRTTFYNILSKDDADYYQFVIEDDLVDSLSVVLSTISGDTSLLLQKFDESRNVYRDINSSANSFYLPNVINLAKDKMSDKQLVGKYQVVIKARTFSTYSLYYYVKGDVIKKNPGVEDVELQLDTGDIIEGFFKKSTPYRLYSFEVDGDVLSSDLRITLSKRSYHFNLYVFKDLSKFTLNLDDAEKETILGYTWKNDYNNQIVISKTDPNFSDSGPYYIVVARDNTIDKSILPDVENFYLGVTDEYDEFILYEGIQHGVTLTDKYKSQGYWYSHSNLAEKFSLSVNVFFGSINVYVDFEPIDEERINNEVPSKFVYAEKDLTESTLITIPPSELQKYCINTENCPISIYIQKNSKMSAQYLLSPKSRSKKPLIMTPGVMTQNTMNVKESHYFIIEEFSANKDGNIVLKFEEGNGDIYMSLSSDLTITEDSFPSEFKWDYKGEDSYQGKIIKVPEMDKNKCQQACRYLVTVIGTSIGTNNDNVVYSIVYSNKAKYVNQNVPIKSDIKSGESHYYTFYFDETAESLYVSLYCKDGDADLYMNYGQKLPTFKEYDWYSANPQMDFLTVDKNDAFFVNQHLAYMRGYYTILIYGYTNSTYSLFITSNPKRIIPIESNSPGTCQCQSKGDVCNFRFDDLISYYEKDTKDVSVVFTSNYVYGYGSMYIKLYNESNYDVNQEFPSSSNNDWSNVNANKRNFVKVDISKNNPKLTKNSMLLITVQCQEKSLFELNAARIRSSSYQYLDSRRQNLFFLEQSETPTILAFYYQENLPINYEIFTYTGTANVKIYQNYTRSAEQAEYNPIAETIIAPSKPYYNYIKNTVKTVGKNVYFQITPNTDVGFYVKLNYEQEWTRVDIGQKSTYLVNSNVFNGYFDMMEEYDDVVLSVRSEGSNMQATLYYTVNVYDRVASDDNVNPFKLTYPDTSKDGIKTDRTFQSLSVKIKQIDKAQYKNKSVRVLFKVVLSGEAVNKNLDKSISVIVTPSTNKIRRYQIRPANIVYSFVNKYVNNTVIFDIHKLKKSDDMIVIELSSCRGSFNYSISKDLSYFDSRADNVEYEKKGKTGRTLLTIKNAKEENYYLSIWTEKAPLKLPGMVDSNNDVEFMLYYYSTEEKKYVKTSSSSALLIPKQLSRSEIELKTGTLKTKDMYGNVQEAEDINFKTFVSSKENIITRMGSLCQLTRMELEKNYQSRYEPNEKRMVISGLKTGVKYAVNIVMENPKTGEIFSFEPVEFTLAYALGMSMGMTIFVVIIIIILLVAVVYYYLKYRKTKEILKYEQNDINSLAKVPGISAEMTNVPDKVKYTTLTSEPDPI